MVCHKLINTDTEDYCRLTDYNKGKLFMEGYYHTKCFQERLKGGMAAQNMAVSVLHKANRMMDSLGLGGDRERKEIVEIR